MGDERTGFDYDKLNISVTYVTHTFRNCFPKTRWRPSHFQRFNLQLRFLVSYLLTATHYICIYPSYCFAIEHPVSYD